MVIMGPDLALDPWGHDPVNLDKSKLHGFIKGNKIQLAEIIIVSSGVFEISAPLLLN